MNTNRIINQALGSDIAEPSNANSRASTWTEKQGRVGRESEQSGRHLENSKLWTSQQALNQPAKPALNAWFPAFSCIWIISGAPPPNPRACSGLRILRLQTGLGSFAWTRQQDVLGSGPAKREIKTEREAGVAEQGTWIQNEWLAPGVWVTHTRFWRLSHRSSLKTCARSNWAEKRLSSIV